MEDARAFASNLAPRRAKRSILSIFTLSSLIAPLAIVCTSWAHSWVYFEQAFYQFGSGAVTGITAMDGEVVLSSSWHQLPAASMGFHGHITPLSQLRSKPSFAQMLRPRNSTLGFHTFSMEDAQNRVHDLWLPHWFLAIITAVPTFLFWAGSRRGGHRSISSPS